jgi:serine/threonine-protein kinase
LLSDGQHIIFGMHLAAGNRPRECHRRGPIVLDAVGGGQRKVLIPMGANPRLLPTGQLAYLHDGSIWAVAFDVDRLEAASDAPVRLVDNVAQTGAVSAGQFAVSTKGSLAYVTGNLTTLGNTLRRLVWVDRKGGEQLLAIPPNRFQQPRLSPDGTRLAISADAKIWVWLLTSDTPMQLVKEEGAVQYNPAGTPDGRDLLFDSNGGGGTEIMRRPADGPERTRPS